MSFPATRAALEAAGYKCKCLTRCKGCPALMEWWLTPAGKQIPMDVMKTGDSPAISHFATCPNADHFRKEPQCCISPITTSPDSLLFQDFYSSSPASGSSSADDSAASNCDEPRKPSTD